MSWLLITTATVVAVALLGWLGSRALLAKLGAASRRSPHEMREGLSANARALVARAFDGLDPTRLLDYHVHVAGNGSGGTGCCITPQMLSWWHPIKRIQLAVYMDSAGVRHFDRADGEFVAHLATLVRTIERHGRHCLLAFDQHHLENGNV